jgi:FkbM family methyltransferase
LSSRIIQNISEEKIVSNSFSTFIKKKVVRKNQNLVSLDEPYRAMAHLLRGCQITGIIDGGASDGRISRRLLRNFPAAHVYAFEPNRFYIEALRLYAGEEPRFHPQFLALSDFEGFADLHITESPGSTSLFIPARHLKEIDPVGSCVKDVEKVKVVTIDGWVERNGNLPIQLIKLDIQAGELRALRGAIRVLKASTLLVYTEIWFNPAYEDSILYSHIDLFFREQGFILYDLFKPKYSPNGMIMWGNAVFVNAKALGL